MGLVRITGTPGVGKSTVHQELRRRGYRSFDGDLDGMSVWRDRATGRIVDSPAELPSDWGLRHAWCMRRSRVEALTRLADAQPVFVCGSVENDSDHWDLFETVVCLVVDNETLCRRLTDRTDNEFGKRPEQLAAALEWNQTAEAHYRTFGAEIVDATQPLADVVDSVVRIATRDPGDDD